MLKTERNTPTMGARVLRAFRKWVKHNRPSHPVRSGLVVFFEHGQWWAEMTDAGEQWSVCDMEPQSCQEALEYGADGFCFEQVTGKDGI